MTRYVHILILIMGFYPLLGQDIQEDFLIKESLYKDYSYLGYEDYLDYERKTKYSYNAHGQKEHIAYWSRSGADAIWTIDFEYFYRYDAVGREVYHSNQHYNENTGEINDIYILKRTYVDDYLAELYYNYKNFESTREDTKITTFNSQGRWTRVYRSNINNDRREEWEDTWEYNTNGCLINSTFSIAVYNNDQLTEYSKNKTEYIYSLDCEYLESKHYYFDKNTETYILISTSREERETDAFGNIILLEHYEKTEGMNTGFVKINAEYHFYDSQNRDTLHILEHVNYDSYRIHNSYKDDGKVVDSYIDVWFPEDSSWVIVWESQSTYDDNSNIILGFFRSKDDPRIDSFQIEEEERFEYNENGQTTYYYSKETDSSKDPPWIIESEERMDFNENGQEVYIYDKKSYSYSGFTRITEDSIRYETACDGRMAKITRKSLIDYSGSVETNTYFDLPDCELEDAPSSKYILFPNPVHNALHLQIEGLPKDLQTKIYDMNGKLMYSSLHQFRNFISLDISHLLPGMYILNITIGEEQILHKFTKI